MVSKYDCSAFFLFSKSHFGVCFIPIGDPVKIRGTLYLRHNQGFVSVTTTI